MGTPPNPSFRSRDALRSLFRNFRYNRMFAEHRYREERRLSTDSSSLFRRRSLVNPAEGVRRTQVGANCVQAVRVAADAVSLPLGPRCISSVSGVP